MSRWQKMYSLQEIRWVSIEKSRDNRKTCLQSCSKKDFKTVNISIANISYKIWIPVIIATMWRPRHTQCVCLGLHIVVGRKLNRNVSANMCLRFLQLIPRPGLKKCIRCLQQLKKDSPLKSSAFHNFSCWIKCIGLVNDNFELKFWFTSQF